jgi:31-O-methyltransferase
VAWHAGITSISRQPRFVRLPDGTAIWAETALEATGLYRDIGETGVYFRHGIETHDGDCIFDVGANIGLYSVMLLRARKRLRIFAFEPVPSIYALAERNMALYRGDASITSFNCALGRAAGVAEGERFAGLSLWATLRPGDIAGAARPDARMRDWAHTIPPNLERLGLLSRRWVDRLQRGLESPVVLPLAVAAIFALTVGIHLRAGGGLRKRRFTCQVRSLSDVILEHNVGQIDVLKIDVEGSEWEVLSGLETALWPRIRQVVVEVHDVAGRVGEMVRLFRHHGFRTEVEQGDWAHSALAGVYTLYARRNG